MAENKEKHPRVRSPAYPSMSLPDAIEKARVIYDKEAHGRHPVPITAIAKDWENASVNGSVLTAVSAIKQFGLFEEDSEKEPRHLKLTSAALNIIVRPNDDPERDELIRTCALLPKLYRRLWDKYGWPLPSDDSIKPYLELEERYSSKFIASIIKDYKASILFAKLAKDDKLDADDLFKFPEVGDFIQWEPGGVDQFPQPLRVIEKSDDGGFVRVEGNMTAIPITETSIKQPPAGTPPAPASRHNMPPRPPGYTPPVFSVTGKQDTYTAEAGEVVVRWPATLTSEEYNDISGWLDMLKSKIKRSVKPDGTGSGAGHGDGTGHG